MRPLASRRQESGLDRWMRVITRKRKVPRKLRKEEWAILCDAASSSNEEDGAKACRWIDVVTHSVLSFLIGCAFRPRDRFGVIDTDMPIKQKLLETRLSLTRG